MAPKWLMQMGGAVFFGVVKELLRRRCLARIPEEAETALERQLCSSDYTVPRKVLGSGRWALVEGLQVAGQSG